MAAKVTSTGEFANSMLLLIFNTTTYANMAINATSSPFTNLYVSLHTASPTATGTQTSSECTFGSYARQPVARTSGGWTVTTNSVVPAAAVTFPAATSGSETATYFGVGTSVSGAGHLLYFGAISPTIAISTGVTPQLTTATAVTET